MVRDTYPIPDVQDSQLHECNLHVPVERQRFLASHEVVRGDKSKEMVAITYDDAPRDLKELEHLLDQLEEEGVKATFFFLGTWLYEVSQGFRDGYGPNDKMFLGDLSEDKKAIQHPDLVVQPYKTTKENVRRVFKRMLESGHELGIHGWQHDRPMAGMGRHEIEKELRAALAYMYEMTNVPIKYLRTPFGSRSQDVLEVAASLNLQHIFWTTGSDGISLDTPNITKENVEREGTSGVIVLSHMERHEDVFQARTIFAKLRSIFQAKRIDTGSAVHLELRKTPRPQLQFGTISEIMDPADNPDL